MARDFDLVVVGGGISATTLVETVSVLCPCMSIGWFSPSYLFKRVKSVTKIGHQLETIDVEETGLPEILKSNPAISHHCVQIGPIDGSNNTVYNLDKSASWTYKYLCLCTGAIPVKIPGTESDPDILEIRDTFTIDVLEKKIKTCSLVAVVGNGGIATELIYKLQNVTIVWIVKDKHLSSVFFDPAAAQFVMESSSWNHTETQKEESKIAADQPGREKGHVFLEHQQRSQSQPGQLNRSMFGSSLGPNWSAARNLASTNSSPKKVIIETDSQVNHLTKQVVTSDRPEEPKYNYLIELTNGNKHSCDLIISATGVKPNVHPDWASQFVLSDEGGIVVDELMTTSVSNIFAAGDVCTVNWDHLRSDDCHWFQMKLWTQARTLAHYAAYCIASKVDPEINPKFHFNFDLFTHVTSFFGFKVILLGLYNGQKLNEDYKIILQVKEGEKYAKVLVKDGRVKGALLIGETDLEETLENLILTQMDVSGIEDHLLDGTVDIEDYFD